MSARLAWTGAYLCISFVLYCVSYCIYNVYLHPLRKFPGPKLWQTTFLFRHFAAMRGDLDWQLKAFHEQYGDVVRYSPEELSFTKEEAWKDIYGHKQQPLAKDPVVYGSVNLDNTKATSIFNANHIDHARIRKQLGHAFSEKALREQEPGVQAWVDLLIEKLRGVAASETTTDMVKWLNFTTFDLIGDMALGKAFGCLQDSQYHSWVSGLQAGTKIGPYIRTVATYTDIRRLWRMLAPASVKAARLRHETYVKAHAAERLSKGVMMERRDFISYILKGKQEGSGITEEEVTANCGFLIIAGSEAAGTAMSGILYHLLKKPSTLEKVTSEVRTAYENESAIDFTTTATKLPYLMACISEGMRAFPPGPTIPPRRTQPGTMTMIAGYQVPGWTSVGVQPLATTHSTANFHKPDEYVPERWLPETRADPSSPFYNDRLDAVQPFSTGPRACLGKGLAYNEMRVILARLVWNFDMSIEIESLGWDKQRTFTLWEKKELMCRLTDVRNKTGC